MRVDEAWNDDVIGGLDRDGVSGCDIQPDFPNLAVVECRERVKMSALCSTSYVRCLLLLLRLWGLWATPLCVVHTPTVPGR